MKYFVLLSIMFLTGCSSNLDIMDDHQSVPVVYAVINAYDTVHYVRVEKTFKIHFKEDWAKLNPDSLKYKNVEVYLHGKMGEQIKWTEKFTETSVIKDDGFFPKGNYQAFKLEHRLPITISKTTDGSPGLPDIDSLVLEVRINDLNKVTMATVKVLRPVQIINYKSRYEIYLYTTYPSVYAMTHPGETPDLDYQFVYQQIEFLIHYKEFYRNGFAVKTIWWMANSGWDDNAYFISPERFFGPMKKLIPDNDSVLYRKLDSIDIALLRTSKFFNNYLFIRDYWENTDNPPYSNFDQSYGMFFCLAKAHWTGMQLNYQSLDSLYKSERYKELKFRK